MTMPTTHDRRLHWRKTMLALALSAGLAPVWAQGMPPRGMPHGPGPMAAAMAPDDARAERMVEHMARELDLQPAQSDQLRALAQAASQDLRALRDEGRTLREERHRLMAAPQLDEAALEALRQRELAHHDKLTARMQRFMIDTAKVLTPEQRQRWAERMQRRGDGPRPHHHRDEHAHPPRR